MDGRERRRQFRFIKQAGNDGFLQGQVAIGDGFPDDFRPLLAAVDAVLIAPDAYAERMQRWLQLQRAIQIGSGIADENFGHSWRSFDDRPVLQRSLSFR